MAYDKWRVYPGGYPNVPGSTPVHKLHPRGNREIETGRKRPAPPPAPAAAPAEAETAAPAES